MMFRDRQEAGMRLAEAVKTYAKNDVVVFALPRGGVVLGAEVARTLSAPLGVILVRKVEHPIYKEYAVGAVVEGEPPLYDQGAVEAIDREWLRSAEVEARRLLWQRHNMYLGNGLEQPHVRNKVVVVVDDGIATGLTMRAAVQALRHAQPRQVIVAVPVASREGIELTQPLADTVLVLDDPDDFQGAVGAHYTEFHQVEDQEVKDLLREVNRNVHSKATSDA